jgi:hypothetical protein
MANRTTRPTAVPIFCTRTLIRKDDVLRLAQAPEPDKQPIDEYRHDEDDHQRQEDAEGYVDISAVSIAGLG